MDEFQVVVTPRIIQKLEIHNVELLEVEEAFFNMNGTPLIDDRPQHKTRPATVWFCSVTGEGRVLKIVGIPLRETKEFVLKSAYDAEPWEIDLYEDNQ